jgi:uncharacterized protein (DUF433 family)
VCGVIIVKSSRLALWNVVDRHLLKTLEASPVAGVAGERKQAIEYWRKQSVTRSLIILDRITSDAAILGGKPIIRGTRISVEMILEWIASGATRDDILRKHAHLCSADIEQALTYAASAVRNEVLATAEVGD